MPERHRTQYPIRWSEEHHKEFIEPLKGKYGGVQEFVDKMVSFYAAHHSTQAPSTLRRTLADLRHQQEVISIEIEQTEKLLARAEEAEAEREKNDRSRKYFTTRQAEYDQRKQELLVADARKRSMAEGDPQILKSVADDLKKQITALDSEFVDLFTMEKTV